MALRLKQTDCHTSSSTAKESSMTTESIDPQDFPQEEISIEDLQKIQAFVQPELDRACARSKVAFGTSLMDDDWKGGEGPV